MLLGHTNLITCFLDLAGLNFGKLKILVGVVIRATHMTNIAHSHELHIVL